MSIYGDDHIASGGYQDTDFEDQMRAEGQQLRIEENTKHIAVKYQRGYGMEQLVRDQLTHDKIRLIFTPF